MSHRGLGSMGKCPRVVYRVVTSEPVMVAHRRWFHNIRAWNLHFRQITSSNTLGAEQSNMDGMLFVPVTKNNILNADRSWNFVVNVDLLWCQSEVGSPNVNNVTCIGQSVLPLSWRQSFHTTTVETYVSCERLTKKLSAKNQFRHTRVCWSCYLIYLCYLETNLCLGNQYMLCIHSWRFPTLLLLL